MRKRSDSNNDGPPNAKPTRAGRWASEAEASPWGNIRRDRAELEYKRRVKAHEATIPQSLQLLMQEHQSRKEINAFAQRTSQKVPAAAASAKATPWTLARKPTPHPEALVQRAGDKPGEEAAAPANALANADEKKASISISVDPLKVDEKNAVVGEKKADVKKDEKKAAKKTGGFQGRLAEQSLESLQALYARFRGRRIVNPRPDQCELPEPVSRVAALQRHARERRLQIGVSQIIELSDDLWLFGRTNSCATVALRLDGFHPFFFITCPEGSTQKDADQLRETLNGRTNRPERWYNRRPKPPPQQKQQRPQREKRRRHDNGLVRDEDDEIEFANVEEDQRDDDGSLLPVARVTLESRMNAVIFSGRDKMSIMRLDFANVAAFKHYRRQLALPNVDKHVGPNPSILIGWRPQLFHEEHTLSQMFFNIAPVNLFDWVEVNPRSCHFLPAKAWTELEEIINQDEERRAEAGSDAEDGDADEAATAAPDQPQLSRAARLAEQLEKRKVKEAAQSRLPRTTTHLEGHCDYRLLKPVQVDSAPPMIVGTFDIETLCWDTVLAQRKLIQNGYALPTFDDDIDDQKHAPPSPPRANATTTVDEWAWAWSPDVSRESAARLAEWMAFKQFANLGLQTSLPILFRDLESMKMFSGGLTCPADPELWVPLYGDTNADGAISIAFENVRTHEFLLGVFSADDEGTDRFEPLSKKDAVDLFRKADQTAADARPPTTAADARPPTTAADAQPPTTAAKVGEKRHLNAAEVDRSLSAATKRLKTSNSFSSESVSDQKRPEQIDARPPPPKLKEGQFPIASKLHDAVFMVATQFSVYGDSDSFLSVIHTLGHCDFEDGDLPDTVVFEFAEDDEIGMLEHWSTMLRHFDLEWLAGFNSIGYDLPYVFQRAKVVGSTRVIRNLSRFQALPHERQRNKYRYNECMPHERRFGNKGVNDQMPLVETPGRIQFCAMKSVKSLEKLNTYSLKEVALELLKGKYTKKDLPHKLISPFWAAGAKHRRRLAIYNYWDVRVTLMLLIKRFLLGHAVEVARAAWTPIQQQMLQGAQVGCF
jgi:hypothetical protein